MPLTTAERQKKLRERNAEELEALIKQAERMLSTFDALKWADEDEKKARMIDCDHAASELHYRVMRTKERFGSR